MKREVRHLIVASLAFSAGLWLTGVLTNLWVMSVYHRAEFIESSFAIFVGTALAGLSSFALLADRRRPNSEPVFNYVMLLAGLSLLCAGWLTFVAFLGGGRVIYRSIID